MAFTVRTGPTPATAGPLSGQSLPAADEASSPRLPPWDCHSHAESANALFSTLGMRVQAERGRDGTAQPTTHSAHGMPWSDPFLVLPPGAPGPEVTVLCSGRARATDGPVPVTR